jgi:ketosteroid isomerase-like protein
MPLDTLAAWHSLLAARDPAGLSELLAEDVVFHSPIVHTPQVGKPITTLYLSAAFAVFNNEKFRYLREIKGQSDAVLEFLTVIDGITVNGVDMIRWNDAGHIVDFKVMVRPLKAINLIHEKMGAMLNKLG